MNRGGVLLALVAGASLGCAGAVPSSAGSPPFTGAGGSTTGAGASTGSCLSDSCVPALQTPVVLAVEIDPPSSSPSGVTQLLNHDVSSADVYQASAAMMVIAGFAAPSGGAVPSSSDVVLTVPPTIPGRPDLSFQSVGTNTDTRSVTATLMVPEEALNAASTLSLTPLPPADQTMPPYNFAMPLSSMMMANLPGDDVIVSGQIQLANQMTPPSTFVARAFQNGAQVSDAALTQSNGMFQVRLPSAAAANQVTIQLSPVAPASGAPQDPWFVSSPITVMPGKSLGVITLPPYNPPVTYDIVVAHGSDGISGVNVRVQALIGATTGTTTGNASYISSAGTDSKGVAALSFLPASMNASMSNALIAYTVTATPPIGSAYGLSCMTSVTPTPLPAGSSGSTPTLANLTPDPRPIVRGRVSSASGLALTGVTVTASGTPDPSSMDCPTPAPVTASTTTDTSGFFSLPLDPGTYQFDYDPPTGSSAPRMTEPSVAVAATQFVDHDVALPTGALVKGLVVGNGMPVGSATVRFFEPRCMGQTDCFGPARTAPRLRGKALTAADGSFRMVIDPQSSP
jgi:hypothetical protein